MEERFIYLVKQQLAKTITAPERQELDALLLSHSDLSRVYTFLFSDPEITYEDDQLESEQSYAAQVVRMHLSGSWEKPAIDSGHEPLAPWYKKMIRTRQKSLAMAVCLLLVIAIGSYYFLFNRHPESLVTHNQIGTKKGSKTHIILPDGTSVWLNADSKISYPDNFQGDTREVSLSGEAYFDVVKNPGKPFVIHTGAMDVKVLGTVFNVRSYPTEATTEASLIHGSIEVTLKGTEKKKIILRPNEKLTVLNNETPRENAGKLSGKKMDLPDDMPILALTRIHFNQADSSNAETSWIYNKLSFDNEGTEKVFSKIEQWYDCEILIDNKNIRSKHFTATFENKTLAEVLEALSMALNFTYEEKEGKIVIK